ncbi:hypothetical protein BC834DRAFT_974274 [Gloeopeniophorella convolvens]|nr:hypothetical protein BC834DRAFT_974274 [Gloeopeniophorella convolvens]
MGSTKKRGSQDDEEKGNTGKEQQNVNDPASKMWAICISKAEKSDEAIVERWKADMDGILIFTGVFSATVAAFLIESYKLLKPDPGDDTVKALQEIRQQLAGISNGERLPQPTEDVFHVQSSSVHVNILWFLSLCISLSCALGATLVQQWARRYLRLAQEPTTPQRRVRIRTYLHEGVEGFRARWIVEAISLLVHAAIFLFFAGLVEFLFSINHKVAHVILGAVAVFAAAYIVLTALPAIFRQCPFQTPLSSTLWYIGHVVILVALSLFTWSNRGRAKIEVFWKHIRGGISTHLAEKAERKLRIDQVALQLALRSCHDDKDLEPFVDAIPGYLRSGDDRGSHVADIGGLLEADEEDVQLSQRIAQLLATCVDADGRMDKSARRRRAIICARAIWEIIRAFLSRNLPVDPPAATCRTLQQLSHDHDPAVAFAALSTVALAEHALLERLSDADLGVDGRKKVVGTLSEVLGEQDPLTSRYNGSRLMASSASRPPDARLIAATRFVSGVLPLIPRLQDPSHEDLDVTRKTIKRLCGGLDGRTFSASAQNAFTEALLGIVEERDAAGRQVPVSTMATYYRTILAAVTPLASTLDITYKDILQRAGAFS